MPSHYSVIVVVANRSRKRDFSVLNRALKKVQDDKNGWGRQVPRQWRLCQEGGLASWTR